MGTVLMTSITTIQGCAPEVKHLPAPETKPHLGPKQTDALLKFNGDTSLYDQLPSFNEQTMATAELLNTVENMLKLSHQLNLPLMSKMAYQIQNSVYSNKDNVRTVDFERSPYADAAFTEANPLVQKELTSILGKIEYQQRLLSLLLDSRTLPAPPKARAPLSSFTKKVKERLQSELEFLQANDIDSMIIDAIQQAFENEIYRKLDQAEAPIRDVVQASTLYQTLSSLEKMFIIFEYTPAKEISDQIIFGYQIASTIESIRSEQAGLTLIVKFWRMMTPEQRLANFKPNSRELYDYLVERNERELSCLASDSCLDLIILVGKKRIFDGLRDYGLPHLQETFNKGAHDYVMELIELALPHEIAIVPQEMKKAILPRFAMKVTELQNIQQDFDGFLRNVLLGWAKQNLYSQQAQKLPLLERTKVRLGLKRGVPFTTSPPVNSETNYHSQTVGASLALTAFRWGDSDLQTPNGGHNQNLLRNMLEQVNKLLMTYDRRPQNESSPSKKQFRVLDSAELIRGLSAMSYHLRDYEQTLFDTHLGRIQIRELNIEALPTDIARQPLFPKDTFFTLAIGNAALQLQALNSKHSPVFTMDTENRVQWLDHSSRDPSSPNVMAGIVDIVDGKRSNLVMSSSLSQFLRALIQFYHATTGIEQTKASRLLEPNSDGKTNLEIILESRADIRELIIGLSNFLSHQIKSDSGATLHTIKIDETDANATGLICLEDQVNSIQALLDTYELLNSPIYLWSAIDTYYALNRSLWNPEVDFYFADSDKTPANFNQRIAALHVLARIKDFLPLPSQQQTDRILKVNSKAFTR
jgi:hypothetical protein